MRQLYDHENRRWFAATKPPGWRWSSFVLGRMACHRTLLDEGVITVSAYRTRTGALRYSDPIKPDRVSHRKRILYRIRVRLKAPISRSVATRQYRSA